MSEFTFSPVFDPIHHLSPADIQFLPATRYQDPVFALVSKTEPLAAGHWCKRKCFVSSFGPPLKSIFGARLVDRYMYGGTALHSPLYLQRGRWTSQGFPSIYSHHTGHIFESCPAAIGLETSVGRG